jgi:hypothetical protein
MCPRIVSLVLLGRMSFEPWRMGVWIAMHCSAWFGVVCLSSQITYLLALSISNHEGRPLVVK